MITIHLNKVLMHSYHGVYEEEWKLGNNYEVNVALSFEPGGRIHSIEQTINYELVYALIRERMKIPTLLLETIAQDLTGEIRQLDERIKKIQVDIRKNPCPIEAMQGEVCVTCVKEF
jgi:dihydroneopterin aldolase